MPIKQEKTRIAVLIVVAVLAVAFAVLEALADGRPTAELTKTSEVSAGAAAVRD